MTTLFATAVILAVMGLFWSMNQNSGIFMSVKDDRSFDVPFKLLDCTGNDSTSFLLHQHRPEREKYEPSEVSLSLPFYIYPELWMMDEATFGGRPIHEAIRDRKIFHGSHKHDNDYHFLLSAWYHPLRTIDPNQAKLFVVPVLFNMLISASAYPSNATGLCWKGRCNREILDYMEETLRDSPWFQRHQGRDHFATLPCFHWDHPKVELTKSFPSILQCHALIYGDSPIPLAENRLGLATMHVGEACDLVPIKTADLVFVGRMQSGIKFRPRRDVCQWMNEWEYNNNISMPTCGRGQRCPALAEARLGFHIRGDSPSSSRLMDTLLSGTVPIFTQSKQYLAVPDFYDWDKVSYFADAKNKTAFIESMKHILADTEGYKTRHANVLRNRDLFDWTTGAPFDVYMYRIQMHLWPETKTNHTTYTILKI